MKLFIMRHGHREDDPTNPKGKHIPPQRPLDPDISEFGEEMAAQTAEMLKDEKIQMIYASPFLRTTHTASIIADKLDVPLLRLEWGLGEHFISEWFSDWPGTIAPQELARRFPRIDMIQEQTGIMPKCSENYWEMHNRSMKTVRILIARHAPFEENFLMVSHAAVSCTVPAGLTSWEGYDAKPYLCGISCLSKTETGWKADYITRASHMTRVMI